MSNRTPAKALAAEILKGCLVRVLGFPFGHTTCGVKYSEPGVRVSVRIGAPDGQTPCPSADAFKAVLDLCNAVCAQALPVQFFKMSRADCEKKYGALVMGRANEVPPGVDEVVLRGQAGQIVCVAAGNLFLLLEDTLVTPPLQECGVAGTRRTLLMERWAPAAGLTVREAMVSVEDLGRAREVFFSNALVGLRPVGRMGDLRWHDHGLCRILFDHYLEDAA